MTNLFFSVQHIVEGALATAKAKIEMATTGNYSLTEEMFQHDPTVPTANLPFLFNIAVCQDRNEKWNPETLGYPGNGPDKTKAEKKFLPHQLPTQCGSNGETKLWDQFYKEWAETF